MALDRNKVIGAVYVTIATCLMMAGAWSFHSARTAAPQPAGPGRADLAAVAAAVAADAPTPSGAAIIVGASYAPADNVFTFDLRPDPKIFSHAPQELFFISAGDMLSCAKQTAALIEMNRDTSVRYRLFDGDGIAREEVILEQGACSDIPMEATRNRQKPDPSMPAY